MSHSTISVSQSEFKGAVQEALVHQRLEWQKDASGEVSFLNIRLNGDVVSITVRRSGRCSLLSGEALADLNPDDLVSLFDRWPEPTV